MSENKNSQNQELESLRVYISLMDQAQQEFRSTKKEIEALWADLCELQLLTLQRPLLPEEEARLDRVQRQYSRKAVTQLRNLDTIEMVMKSHEAQFARLSDFRDPEMQEAIFQVICKRFMLESTRIFGSSEVAIEAIRNFIQKKL